MPTSTRPCSSADHDGEAPTHCTSTICAPLAPTALAKWTLRALTRGTGNSVSFSGPSITSSRPVACFTASVSAGL